MKASDIVEDALQSRGILQKELSALENSRRPKVSQMVDGVTYSTDRMESLCTSKTEQGDEFYTELFKDLSGRYFLVYYQLWEGSYNHLSTATKEASKRFWARYSDLPVSEMK